MRAAPRPEPADPLSAHPHTVATTPTFGLVAPVCGLGHRRRLGSRYRYRSIVAAPEEDSPQYMPVTSSMFLISETREQPMRGWLAAVHPAGGQTAGELADEVIAAFTSKGPRDQ